MVVLHERHEGEHIYEVNEVTLVRYTHCLRCSEGWWASYRYTWHHNPTGKQGTRTVYCNGPESFRKLLAYWNRDSRWEYKEVKP